MKEILRREVRSLSPARLLEETVEGIRGSIEVVTREIEVEVSDEEDEEQKKDEDGKDDEEKLEKS